jgi:hypothetical protein
LHKLSSAAIQGADDGLAGDLFTILPERVENIISVGTPGGVLVLAAAAASGLALKLDWWAGYRPVGAENTTIAGLGAKQGAAFFTFIEILAGIRGHLLDLAVPAMRAGDLLTKLNLCGHFGAPIFMLHHQYNAAAFADGSMYGST